MSIDATGEYLRVLRDARKMSRNALGQKIGTDHSLIERIEKGQTDTRGSLLLRILHTLEGSPEQLMQLMVNPDATQEDGRRLAEEWLTSGSARYFAREDLDRVANNLAADPTRFQKWLGYGERLIEEANDTAGLK
jgi:transcriptional regulator with XRE-family HTH domain